MKKNQNGWTGVGLLYIVLVILTIFANLALLAGAVWVVVMVLKWMGVLS